MSIHPFFLELLLTVEEVLSWREDKKERARGRPKPYFYQTTTKGDIYPLDHEQFPMRMDSVIHAFQGGVVLQVKTPPIAST